MILNYLKMTNCRLDWENLIINFPFTYYIIFSEECYFAFNDSKGWFHSAYAHLLSIDNHSGKTHVYAGISCAPSERT